MGHLVGKDVYRKLGTKVDGLTVRAPWNETMRAILKELYSPDEAEVFIGMPYGFATLDRIARSTGHERVKLQGTLERLAQKGLVVDFEFEGGTQYMPNPLFVGIFEFTMMRTGPGVDSATLGKLFHAYLNESGVVEANAAQGEKVTIMRALPHDGAVRDHVEILDYEKASAILAEKERFALGICSCRHEKLHAGVRECDGPLDVCSSFDRAADFLVRHGMAREVSKAEMQDNLTRSRERGLVLSADNVQKNAGFICNCCACCCNLLRGVRDFGYPNFIVTSSFIASPDQSLCQGCGKCSKTCPIEAIGQVLGALTAPLAERLVGAGDERRGDDEVAVPEVAHPAQEVAAAGATVANETGILLHVIGGEHQTSFARAGEVVLHLRLAHLARHAVADEKSAARSKFEQTSSGPSDSRTPACTFSCRQEQMPRAKRSFLRGWRRSSRNRGSSWSRTARRGERAHDGDLRPGRRWLPLPAPLR